MGSPAESLLLCGDDGNSGPSVGGYAATTATTAALMLPLLSPTAATLAHRQTANGLVGKC